jgi:hypothetical protein
MTSCYSSTTVRLVDVTWEFRKVTQQLDKNSIGRVCINIYMIIFYPIKHAN